MSHLFLSALLVVAADPPSSADTSPPEVNQSPPVRTELASSRSLLEEARAALKAARTTATKPPSDAATRRLLDVYNQLLQDDTLRLTDRQRLLGTVGVRLARISDALRYARPRRSNETVREKTPDNRQPADVQQPPDHDILAQQPAGPLPGFAAGPPRPPVRGAADFGQDLVDLIQDTIAPASWDVNGGPGSIRYYRPLRVLVVR